MTSATKDQDVENRKVNFGAYVDFKIPWLESLHLQRISLLDETRIHKVSFRAGYRYVRATDAKTPKEEHRLQTDVTLRWGLPASMLLTDRNQLEYRLFNGAYSWRYRLQLQVERDFKISRLTVIPFVSAEPFYDSTYGRLSRWRYEAGITFPIHHWAIYPYYAHQVVKASCPPGFRSGGINYYFLRTLKHKAEKENLLKRTRIVLRGETVIRLRLLRVPLAERATVHSSRRPFLCTKILEPPK